MLTQFHHDPLTLFTAAAALVAAVYQTYYRFKTKSDLKIYGRDKWRWPRGIFGDLSVIATWVFLFLPDQWNFGKIEALSSCRAEGCLVLLCAIALRVWAQYHLGPNWSNSVALRYGHQLVMTGPYRYVRHPMYTGYCVMAIGGMLVSANPFVGILWLCFLPQVVKRACLEERGLEVMFDERFRQYRRDVGMFLPRLIRSE